GDRRGRAEARGRGAEMTVQTASLKGLDLLDEIERLKRERNAVILAHYYQKPEIQDLADFVGDSLDLSRKAAATDADVIAFCGVRCMAVAADDPRPAESEILAEMDSGLSGLRGFSVFALDGTPLEATTTASVFFRV